MYVSIARGRGYEKDETTTYPILPALSHPQWGGRAIGP